MATRPSQKVTRFSKSTIDTHAFSPRTYTGADHAQGTVVQAEFNQRPTLDPIKPGKSYSEGDPDAVN